jgi:hypothetical protein
MMSDDQIRNYLENRDSGLNPDVGERPMIDISTLETLLLKTLHARICQLENTRVPTIGLCTNTARHVRVCDECSVAIAKLSETSK